MVLLMQQKMQNLEKSILGGRNLIYKNIKIWIYKTFLI